MIVFVILIAIVFVWAGGQHGDDGECEGCYQLPSNSTGPDGACCYGSIWVKKTAKQEDCEVLGFVWAGPYTDASACRHLKPCCYTNNGTCADTICFDCVMNGGTPIDKCEDCSAETTTTRSTKTKRTITGCPGCTTPPTSTPTPTPPPGPDDGCCCLPDGSEPVITSAADCHGQNGVYRGDGSTCEGDNVCRVKCCDPVENSCIPGTHSSSECEDMGGVFAGAGDCNSETCGGACCIAGRAVLAHSESECCDRGGTFLGFGQPLNDDLCERACCLVVDDKRRCQMKTVSECLDAYGTPFNAGDTCHKVKCSGACCFDGEQSETSSEGSARTETFGPSTCTILDNSPSNPASLQCEDQDGVYQGDGSTCPFTDDSSESSHADDSETEDDDDDDHSGVSTATIVYENGQCMNDGACCLRDKEQGDENGCIRVGTIAQCVGRNGTFQGIGSRCTDSKICKKSACCLGEHGCLDVHIGTGQVECELKGGRYVGDGTTCSLPGMCDRNSGACCCDGMCLNMPNATTCYNYGGCTFRGTGTDCCHEGLCEDFQKHEGACCIQNSYLEDGAQCVMMPNAIACAFRGGVWRGKKTNCDNADYTCGPLTGACCIDGIAYDDMTASECKKCNGKFAGPGSSSGDEGVCDPTHRGACCKRGHGCEDSTYAQCKRSGGNFQGPGTCCNDRDICTPCEPCSVEAPACESDADCEDESVCVAQFGKCMVPASRIPQKRHWNPISHASAMRLKVVPKAKLMVSNMKLAEQHEESGSDSSSSSSSSSSSDGGDWREDDDLPDGPFSCGSNATIGRPCVLHPCSGKCAIGVCAAPPPGTVSNACESICTRIHEYDCNCECRDPWWQTCAFIAGATYNDTDSDNELNIDVDQLYTEQPFDVSLYSIPENSDSEVLVDTKTSTDGRYSFSQLPGGTYRVVLDVPAGYRIEDGNGPEQIVTVTCLPPGDAPPTDIAKRNVMSKGAHSQVLTIVSSKAKSSHIKDNVYYLIAPGQPNGGSNIEDDPTVQPSNLTSATTASTVLAVMIIGLVVLCLGVIVFAVLSSRRLRARPISTRMRNRVVTQRQ